MGTGVEPSERLSVAALTTNLEILFMGYRLCGLHRKAAEYGMRYVYKAVFLKGFWDLGGIIPFCLTQDLVFFFLVHT